MRRFNAMNDATLERNLAAYLRVFLHRHRIDPPTAPDHTLVQVVADAFRLDYEVPNRGPDDNGKDYA